MPTNTSCLQDPFCASATVDVAILTQTIDHIVESNFIQKELDIMDIPYDLFKCIFYSKDGENFCLSTHPSVCTLDTIAGPNTIYPGYGHYDDQSCHLNWYVSFSPSWRRIGDCVGINSKPRNFKLTEELLSEWENNCSLPRKCWDPCMLIEIENDLNRITSLCDLDNCAPICSRTWTDVLSSIIGQSYKNTGTNGFLYEDATDCICKVWYYDDSDSTWKEYSLTSSINPNPNPMSEDSSVDSACEEEKFTQAQWDFYHSILHELINENDGGTIQDPVVITREFNNGSEVKPHAYHFYATCIKTNGDVCVACDNVSCTLVNYTICCEISGYIVNAVKTKCIIGPFKRVLLNVGTIFKNPHPACKDILIKMRYCVQIPEKEFRCINGYCSDGLAKNIDNECC